MKELLQNTHEGLRTLRRAFNVTRSVRNALSFLFYLWTGLGIVFGAAFATLIALIF